LPIARLQKHPYTVQHKRTQTKEEIYIVRQSFFQLTQVGSCHNRVCRFSCNICGHVAAEKARLHLKDRFPKHVMLVEKQNKRTIESDEDEDDEGIEEPVTKKVKLEYEMDTQIEKQSLLTKLKQLILTDSAINPIRPLTDTMFYDLVIRVEGMLFYCSKAILALRSEHFRNIITEAFTKDASYPTKVEVKDTSPPVFQHVLEYLVSGSMEVTDAGENVDVYLYAASIGLDVAQQTIGSLLDTIVNQQDVSASVKVLNRLVSFGIDIKGEKFAQIVQLVSDNAKVLFVENVNQLSRELLLEVLKLELKVPENIIFKKVVDWGVRKLFDPSKELATLQECEKKKLRESIDPLFAQVRFEYMTLEEVMRELEPTGIFTQLEIFQILKAMPTAKNGGEPYSILGVTYPEGRKRRLQ
jgi:hypothetical protein